MNRKRSAYVLPALLLLSLSLASTASTELTRAEAQSGDSAREFTVYIDSLKSQDQKLVLTADEIGWYEGPAADAIFAERDPESAAELGGTPDGYYIVNDSDTLSSYPVSPDAQVVMQIYDRTGKLEDLDINWNEEISLAKFTGEFAKKDIIDLSQSPYHVTVKDGQIVLIVQQYTP
ncbi:hypothetical protein [Paenibacillus tengchongensis]|uniref:hypothetical protein n=1 Tax=Paenibacillus tengchongensis TaxID=2608684 RepID=UPI00124BCE23|nr:hypothetical protein [Paenibacillus tengchongensis]